MTTHERRTPFCAFLLTALVASLALLPDAAAQLPAFPGAEGFGAYATGGRGGDVYYVNNLNNSGPGSFADAIGTVPANGRTIVFGVSGYIHVNKTALNSSKVTIAGQTAPGDGIGFKDGSFIINGSDIIIRHVRFRYGDQAAGGDCINLDEGISDVILDHVSMAFSTDENISSFSQSPRPDFFTFQWSLNAWGLESHSAGGLWDLNRVTTHHTLWAHNHTRNPKARPDGLLDWINNVTFDWDIGFIMGDSETPSTWKANVIGNYFICPPGNLRSVALEKARIDRNGNHNFRLHVGDNLFDKNGNTLLDGSDYGYGLASGSYQVSNAPIVVSGAQVAVTQDSPLTAYKKIVSRAGPLRLDALASIPLRDEVDTILINNLVTLKRNHVSHENQTGASNNGMGFLNSAPAPADGDVDGMPDIWEQTLGWNPAGQDHNTPLASSGGQVSGLTFFPPNTPAGYTRLEEYLHFLTVPHATIPMSTPENPGSFSCDLRKFAAGFNKAPVVFALSNITNGTASLQPDGYTVEFAPAPNYSGRARFDFNVTDGDGSSWTQSMLVLVSGALALPSAPSDLSASAVSNSEVVLEWTDNSANETGFRIESSPDGISFSEIGSVGEDVIGFTNAVAPESTFYYRVRAYTVAGNSGYSNIDSATTPPGSPAAPASITATPANSRVSVSWDDSPGATAYKVKRSISSGGGFAAMATLAGTSFEDLYAVNGTTYYYVVSALNAGGESDNSSEASAAPSGDVTYPAEDGTYGGGAVFENSNGGFNGTGYVNSPPDGGYLQFDDVDAGGGGSVTLRFRNALGNTARTGRLIVNGVTNNISFASTGAWTTWVDKDVVASLNPGTANYVRLETSGQDLANIDELTVFGTAVAPPPATPAFDGAVQSGGNLVMNGFGGLPFDTYLILASSNLALGLSEWTRIATNQLDANGVFTMTNALNPEKPEWFYRLELP